MPHLTVFGHLDTWLLLAIGWVGIAIVTALIFGALARIGGGEGRRGK
jgi:hypothetical protein